MIEARVEEYGSGYLIRPLDEPVADWLSSRAGATMGWTCGTEATPAPDLVLEDHWTFLRVRPASEAGRRWVAGTLMRARRRFGRVVAADARSGAALVGPHYFRAVVGAAEAVGLVVRVSEP